MEPVVKVSAGLDVHRKNVVATRMTEACGKRHVNLVLF
jgi:hypothetical protein